MKATILVGAACAMLAAGCAVSHTPATDAGAPITDASNEAALDASGPVGSPPSSPRDEDRCRVRWYCHCPKDGGACAREDGSPCQPGDLRSPDDDPCRALLPPG